MLKNKKPIIKKQVGGAGPNDQPQQALLQGENIAPAIVPGPEP